MAAISLKWEKIRWRMGKPPTLNRELPDLVAFAFASLAADLTKCVAEGCKSNAVAAQMLERLRCAARWERDAGG